MDDGRLLASLDERRCQARAEGLFDLCKEGREQVQQQLGVQVWQRRAAPLGLGGDRAGNALVECGQPRRKAPALEAVPETLREPAAASSRSIRVACMYVTVANRGPHAVELTQGVDAPHRRLHHMRTQMSPTTILTSTFQCEEHVLHCRGDEQV
jgi:hypothetical protein